MFSLLCKLVIFFNATLPNFSLADLTPCIYCRPENHTCFSHIPSIPTQKEYSFIFPFWFSLRMRVHKKQGISELHTALGRLSSYWFSEIEIYHKGENKQQSQTDQKLYRSPFMRTKFYYPFYIQIYKNISKNILK